MGNIYKVYVGSEEPIYKTDYQEFVKIEEEFSGAVGWLTRYDGVGLWPAGGKVEREYSMVYEVISGGEIDAIVEHFAQSLGKFFEQEAVLVVVMKQACESRLV